MKTVILALLVLLPAGRALACGGVLCGGGPVGTQPQMVEQTGERILFARDDQGRLLSYIQIAYSGTASEFSWILPVVGKPDVSVGTDQVFTLLDQATAPNVGFAWSFDQCSSGSGSPQMGCGTAASADSPGDGNYMEPTPPVANGYQPLGQGRSGPYDYAVLPGTSASDALSWLSQNGYYAPPEFTDLLRPYLDGTHNLLALRLTKDATAGDIVPVVVHSDEATPCVPLHLTAVGAQKDMGVLVWILGEARAVPVNYASVEPNLAALDFQGGGGNYDALVTRAVDAAPGGEGFVTQFAGKHPGFAGALTQNLPDLTDLSRSASALYYVTSVQNLGRAAGWNPDAVLGFLRRWFPEPDSLKSEASEAMFYGDPTTYVDAYSAMSFDPAAATADLDRAFEAPLRDTQGLLDSRPYLTRLYTRISPEEMIEDPTFDENSDLPDVSNQLTATAHVVCEGKPTNESPVRLDLPDGTSLWFESMAAMNLPLGGPGARRVLRDSRKGPGDVMVDNAPTIDAGHGDPRGCGGCRSSAGGAPWLLLTAVLVGRSLLRRRVRFAPRGA